MSSSPPVTLATTPVPEAPLQGAAVPMPAGIWKLAAVTGALFCANAIISPMLETMIRSPFGLSKSELSRFMAVNAVAHLLLGVPAGILSDRLGRRLPMLAISLIGSGVCYALIPWMTNYNALLCLRFVEGVFGAAAGTLVFARVLDIATDGNRGRSMAAVTAALPIGYLVGPALAAALGDHHPHLLMGIGGALLAGAGVWCLAGIAGESRASHHEATLREMAAALRAAPKLLVPMTFGFVDKLSFGALAVLTSSALAEIHGAPEVKTSGLVMAGFWLAFLVGCAPLSRLMERVGAWKLMFLGSASYGVAFMALAMPGLYWFAGMMGVCGFLSALMYVPSLAIVGDLAPPQHRGTAMAAFNTLGMLGFVVGLVAAGIMGDKSYALAYGFAGGLEIACAAAGLLLMRSVAAR